MASFTSWFSKSVNGPLYYLNCANCQRSGVNFTEDDDLSRPETAVSTFWNDEFELAVKIHCACAHCHHLFDIMFYEDPQIGVCLRMSKPLKPKKRQASWMESKSSNDGEDKETE